MKTLKITLKKQKDDTTSTKSQFSSNKINFERVLGVERDTKVIKFVSQLEDLTKLPKFLNNKRKYFKS